MSLDDFERRLKKLASPESGEYITEDQLVEVFKDHHTLKTITNANSLVRFMLTHPSFKKFSDADMFYIPYLLILGCLYCAGNETVRGARFFEIVEYELTLEINAHDEEFLDCTPKLLEVAWTVIMDTYEKFPPTYLPPGHIPAELKKSWKKSPEELRGYLEEITADIGDEIFGKQ